MFNLNEAFDKLRRKVRVFKIIFFKLFSKTSRFFNPIIFQVPTFAYEKRLSRIETLRLAITYIAFMGELLGIEPSSPKPEYIPREYYLPNWISCSPFPRLMRRLRADADRCPIGEKLLIGETSLPLLISIIALSLEVWFNARIYTWQSYDFFHNIIRSFYACLTLLIFSILSLFDVVQKLLCMYKRNVKIIH